MKLTPEYEALCELCDTAGWRLELGHAVIPVVKGTIWWLRVTNPAEEKSCYAEAKFADIAHHLNQLVERVHAEIVDREWISPS